jgi:nitrogenase molybdenum-iron protein alpha chain
MGKFDGNKIQGRESRLSTLSAYVGDSHGLIKKESDKQYIRTFSQATFDEVIFALKAISNIEDSAVIVHGPAGCSTVNLKYRSEGGKLSWYTTNLNERDTILGGEDKLRDAVAAAYYKHKPEIIFIVATPVVAINNDDISAVILELSEELNTKIVPIFTDGFKSKTSINGYDLVFHAIGKYLLGKGTNKKTEDFINLISVSENSRNIYEILSLLNELNIKVNLLPQYSSYKGLVQSTKASLSIALNDDEGFYLGEGLEEEFYVPYINTPVPIGIKNSANWLGLIGEALGLSKEAKVIIDRETSKNEDLINSVPLSGVKIYIDLETSIAISIVSLIKELGGEVIGVTVDEVDEINKHKLEELKYDTPIHIANGQSFETANILKKLKPDIFISNRGKSGWVSRFGIIPISIDKVAVYGFSGGYHLSNLIRKTLGNKGYISNLEKDESSVYKKSWLTKSSNWYIKQEVK